MLRKNSHSESDSNQPNNESSSETLAIQEQFRQLEEFIINTNNLPLTPYKFLNEDQFFAEMDRIWENMPDFIQEAAYIVKEQNSILKEAYEHQDYIIKQAQQEAERIKNQTRIVQQARQEAAQIQSQTEKECDEFRQITLQEIEKLRQQASAECEQLRKDADDYAASVLRDLEQRLTQMLEVTRNGRDSLQSSQQEEPKPKRHPKRRAS